MAGTVVVDGNNVMGAAADGWWRDRPAAVLRLLARLQCYTRATGDAVLLVLDVPQADLPEGDADGVTVRYATRRGRDAADDRNPAWFLNLRDNPEVDVTVEGRTRAMKARVASAEEKTELWPQVVEAYKGYGQYQERTERQIPLVILEP